MRRGRGLGRINAIFGLSVGVLLVAAISAYAEEGKRLDTKEEPSKTIITPYGRVELDVLYNTRNTNPLDPTQFNGYSTAAGNSSHRSSSFNPRWSVIGVRADRSGSDRKLSGVVEVDFFGGTDNAGNIPPRLRLANIGYEQGANKVVVGQDWVPIMALNPDLVDFSIMGYGGNLWQRIPQVTLTHKFNANISGTLTAMQFERGLSGQKVTTTGSGSSEAAFGAPDSTPYWGARLGYTGTGNAEGVLVALSGAYRHYVSAPCVPGAPFPCNPTTPSNININSYLFGTELVVPLGPIKFSGEIAYGKALGAEFFRFGQDRNIGTGQPIRTTVGWAQLSYAPSSTPVKDFTFLVGYGFDNPNNGDLNGDTAPSDKQYLRNQRTFVTMILPPIWTNFNVALEWNYLTTEWTTREHFDGSSFTLATWFNF